jgi:ribose transport system substrate-binding protein
MGIAAKHAGTDETGRLKTREDDMTLRSVVWSCALILGLGAAMGFGDKQSFAAGEPTQAEQDAALSHIPAAARQYYDHYWYNAPITGNLYANWTPPPPPWQFCLSDSMLGTSWRTDLLNEMKKINAQLHAAGLAKAEVLSTDSNNNIGIQLTQFNNLSRQGCNVIVSTPSNPTGMCSGMKDGLEKGVLSITVQSPVNCPYAMNVGSNQYYGGRELADWVGKALGGKGNVLILSGVPGISTTIGLEAGSKAALAKYPGIKIVGTVYGFWNEATSKTEMVKWLATHPQKLDGIVSYGDMAVAADEALAQSGRPPVMQADGTNECAYIAYWHEKKLHTLAFLAGGGSNGYEAMYVALKMLSGAQPVTNMVWFPLPALDDQSAEKLFAAYPGITHTSSCWADAPDHHLASDSYIDAFFTGGKPIPTFKP